MKYRFLVAVIFLASCASQQPAGLSDTKKQANKDQARDVYECAREATFGGVGTKQQVFDNCMKARGYKEK